MDKHTEGQIASGGANKYLYDGDENVMAYVYSSETDMNRLAAAWNAAESIPTEALTPGSVKALVDALEAQEVFETHAVDCDGCSEGSHCEAGQELSMTAQTLRDAALVPFKGPQPAEAQPGCPRCNDTGARPLTEDELDAALESCDPEEAPGSTRCGCAIGQQQQKAFNSRIAALVEADLKEQA